MTARALKGTWSIDVCRTCGRLAQWPFCAHRGNGPAWGTEPLIASRWYETITVKGTWHPNDDYAPRENEG